MIKFKAVGKNNKKSRARYGVCEADAWNLDLFLNVVLANGLELLTNEQPAYPSDKTLEQWNRELRDIAGKFKWLHGYDRTSDDLLKWCDDNAKDFWIEAYNALRSRRQQIIEEAFDWMKHNYQHLWV